MEKEGEREEEAKGEKETGRGETTDEKGEKVTRREYV